jgi:hypothetical protein
MSNGLTTTPSGTANDLVQAKESLVLTKESMAGGDQEIVDANVNVVNAMYAELLEAEEIAPNALRSYYVDFYLTQSLDGGFAQYVFAAPEREDIDTYIREGLEAMGALAHLDLFNRTVGAFGSLSEDDAEAYLNGDAHEGLEEDPDGGTAPDSGVIPEAVQLLDELDGEFEELLETEDITALNAAWLRGQEDLLVLDDEELDRHIAERVSRITNLHERQAEAAEDALLEAPEFELIIRELCDVAGHTLVKITMGDPNYDHNGEATLAWHFSTDQGEFLMVEDDDEAFMIHPDTRENVAAVEFEEADGGLPGSNS